MATVGEKLGDRLEGWRGKYLDHLAAEPEFLEDIESKIVRSIFYASPSVCIDMSTDEWDAVLVLMREGKKALGLDDG